jgi:organic hydroperoxide reductase OsmC/OhrA
MDTKKAFKTFHYQSNIVWQRGRRGIASAPPKPELDISSPPEFKGESGFWTPEDLFVASINACTLLTFVAYAHNKALPVVAYKCSAEGVLEFVDGKYRFREVILRPQVVLRSEKDLALAREVLESAHADCFITNSTSAEVKLIPELRLSIAAA